VEKGNVHNRFNYTSILKLGFLRQILKLKPAPISSFNELESFNNILSKAKDMVSRWNGKFYFVYLPDFNRYKTGNQHPYHNNVLDIVRGLNIPVIDIHEKVFSNHLEPLVLFPFRMHGHYIS